MRRCIPPSGAGSWRATATGQSENRDKPREVVQGCITRWRVEETIRYIKQSYRLEHMRLLDYQRLKNMAALVVAVSYFAAAWLCRKVKLEALANHVAKVSRKMYEAPEFFYYAIADGLRWLFVCHGR